MSKELPFIVLCVEEYKRQKGMTGKEVIALFKEEILPQFPHKNKIRIVNEDALVYADGENRHDFVFADIWHDPSDGCDLYLKLKACEREGVAYEYWIENTLKLYL